MPAPDRSWTGGEWQDYVDQLLLRRFGLGEYQTVPDTVGGDLGIEGFSRDGCAFQCYAAEGFPSAAELYERQRDKMTADLRKLVSNRAKLQLLLGRLVLRRWILLVPRFSSRELVAQAQRKSAELRGLGVPYIGEDFEVTVITDDAFSVERAALQRDGLYDIVLPEPAVDAAAIGEWSTGEANSELMSNINRKLAVIVPPESLSAILEQLLSHYLRGQHALTYLRDNFPDAYRRIGDLAKAREQILIMQSAVGEVGRSLSPHVEEFRDDVSDAVKGMSGGAATTIAMQSVADWMMRCPLDFN